MITVCLNSFAALIVLCSIVVFLFDFFFKSVYRSKKKKSANEYLFDNFGEIKNLFSNAGSESKKLSLKKKNATGKYKCLKKKKNT